MCFGGGKPKPAKSADEFYSEMKPSFGELPSLRMSQVKEKVDRKGPAYEGVKKKRSLLNMEESNG
jgi:hypothetical protein